MPAGLCATSSVVNDKGTSPMTNHHRREASNKYPRMTTGTMITAPIKGFQVNMAKKMSDAIRVKGRISLHQSTRSEEHTSELQSRENLVCRLLLEKKKKTKNTQKEIQQK